MTDVVEDHINPVDAFTFTLERDPLLRATIIAVATFDGTPSWEVLVDRVDRATRLVPRFREKLVQVPFGLAPARWVVDPDFDLSLHVRRAGVHDGGGMDAVVEFARAAGLTAFDHERPLWEFTLFEGLPHGASALVMKIHHALTDGIGGIEIAAHVVDLERGPVDMGPMPPAPAPSPHSLLEVLTEAAGFHSRRITNAGVEVGRAALREAGHLVRDPAGAVAEGIDTGRAVARFVRPVTASLSPIMSERRPARHQLMLDVPMQPMRDAARTVGGTLNDAFLAGISGGMRRYHDRHGAVVDRLRLTMPISVRAAGDGPGGNKVTLERFELPVGDLDPAERMATIDGICRAMRDDPAIPYSALISSVLNLLPVDVTAGMLKHVDFLASNVPGFGDEVFVGGARLEAFHVFGPTLGSAANITLMSYRDTCHIGVTVDAGAVPDPDAFRLSLAEGFAEVTALAP
jgi:diacylglycerol O-acyltransferase / wax synthase